MRANDQRAAPLNADRTGFSLNRRRFLGTVAAATSALLVGGPIPAQAAKTKPKSLQRKVLDLVAGVRRRGKLKPYEKTSWMVYDLTASQQLVSINAAVPRQAASMIKPFVAQAYFIQAAKYRKVRYTEKDRITLTRMIQKSNNAATNKLIDKVGRTRSGRGPRDVERILKKRSSWIFQHTKIVEHIPKGGCTYRNKAAAQDYDRFLRSIYRNELPYSREMCRLMRLPNNDRIVQRVPAMSSSVRVLDKTGSTARVCGNMGIIEAKDRQGRKRAWTIVGIIERPTRAPNFTRWIRSRGNLIRQVSGLVFQHMKERYDLV